MDEQYADSTVTSFIGRAKEAIDAAGAETAADEADPPREADEPAEA